MNDDRLRNLLRDADAAAPPPPVRDLATAVRERARRRSRRRRAAVLATVVLLPMSALAVALLHKERPAETASIASRPVQVDDVALRDEAIRLRAESGLQTAVALRLRLQADRRAHLARERSLMDAGARTPSFLSERDKAALTLLDHGDRLRGELQQVEAALAAYRRAIELFPESQWAAVARKRIEEIKPRAAGMPSADAA